VADLQTILNARYGADLEVDGNFGKATEAAVKAFQKAHGLTADGIVGAKTWKAMGVLPGEQNIAPAIPAPEPDNQPPTICIPFADWLEIKAAIAAAYHIVKKYEGVE
jgi:peptidoglycan hydrolase-like protein with peptidoglycan-binding domain